MSNAKSRKKTARDEYAQSHPIRARVLTLYEQDEQRSLAAKDLLPELADRHTTRSAVAYHVRVLRDTGLLPKAAS